MRLQTLSDLKNAPKKDTLVENMMKCPGLYGLIARQKVGKSTLALQLIDCLANNKPFLGNKVCPAPALYISTEMSANQVYKKFKEFKTNVSDKDFFYLDKRDFASFSIHDLLYQLVTFAEDKKGKLVVIDILGGIDFGKYDLNNYQDMGQKVLPQLRELTEKFNITLIFVHHLNKNSDTLGSTAIDSTVDGKLVLLQNNINDFTLLTENRDFPPLEISLKKNENQIMEVVEKHESDELDLNLIILLNYVIGQKEVKATSGELASKLNLKITPSLLTRLVKSNEAKLNKQGLFITDERTANARTKLYKYVEPLDE